MEEQENREENGTIEAPPVKKQCLESEKQKEFQVMKKRTNYLQWDEYFMAVAFLSAQRSKDPRSQVRYRAMCVYSVYISSQVGACVVNQEKKIVGIGYNGMPNGCSDDELPWSREADSRLNTKYPYGKQDNNSIQSSIIVSLLLLCSVCHAELNAILNKNSADVKGCTLYVALFPCNECAKLVIQSGISRVLYVSDKYHDNEEMVASRKLLDMAGVIYRYSYLTHHVACCC